MTAIHSFILTWLWLSSASYYREPCLYVRICLMTPILFSQVREPWPSLTLYSITSLLQYYVTDHIIPVLSHPEPHIRLHFTNKRFLLITNTSAVSAPYSITFSIIFLHNIVLFHFIFVHWFDLSNCLTSLRVLKLYAEITWRILNNFTISANN